MVMIADRPRWGESFPTGFSHSDRTEEDMPGVRQHGTACERDAMCEPARIVLCLVSVTLGAWLLSSSAWD